MNSRLRTSRTGRIWTDGVFPAPRQYWSNRANTMAWLEDHVAKVNGPLPHSAPRARRELGTPHRTPPFLPTHDSDRMEPKVEARMGKKAPERGRDIPRRHGREVVEDYILPQLERVVLPVRGRAVVCNRRDVRGKAGHERIDAFAVGRECDEGFVDVLQHLSAGRLVVDGRLQRIRLSRRRGCEDVRILELRRRSS